MRKWLIFCKQLTKSQVFLLAAFNVISMEPVMMQIKETRQVYWKNGRKIRSKGRKDARKTGAEAQEQENVHLEEEVIINASAEEDMQEDIVKEVVLPNIDETSN